MTRVGILASRPHAAIDRFKARMGECNLIDGESIEYTVQVANGASAKLRGLAEELFQDNVDLIAAVGAVAAHAAYSVTAQIPIVYLVVVDPIIEGLAARSGHPLPRMTGITTFDPGQALRQLSLLRSIKTDLTSIAYLADAAVSECLANSNVLAASAVGLKTKVLHITGPEPDLAEAFATMQGEGAQALIALEHPLVGMHAMDIVKRAVGLKLPTVLPREHADAGGLFSYGTSLSCAADRMAILASHLLAGEEATNIPIETFHSPELVINMQMADRLGLVIPPDILSCIPFVYPTGDRSAIMLTFG